jgi:hypothetical protein
VPFDRTTPARTNPAHPGAPAPVRYSLEFGHTYVPYDEVADFVLLDPAQQDLLAAWADTLLPGDGAWPRASTVGAHLYADNCAARAPRLRALLLRALARLDALAMQRMARSFGAGTDAERTELLRELEQGDDGELFEFVLELVAEGYYRDLGVLRVVQERTGFRVRAPVDGVELEPFDEALVEEMAERPPLTRQVPA